MQLRVSLTTFRLTFLNLQFVSCNGYRLEYIQINAVSGSKKFLINVINQKMLILLGTKNKLVENISKVPLNYKLHNTGFSRLSTSAKKKSVGCKYLVIYVEITIH